MPGIKLPTILSRYVAFQREHVALEQRSPTLHIHRFIASRVEHALARCTYALYVLLQAGYSPSHLPCTVIFKMGGSWVRWMERNSCHVALFQGAAIL